MAEKERARGRRPQRRPGPGLARPHRQGGARDQGLSERLRRALRSDGLVEAFAGTSHAHPTPAATCEPFRCDRVAVEILREEWVPRPGWPRCLDRGAPMSEAPVTGGPARAIRVPDSPCASSERLVPVEVP